MNEQQAIAQLKAGDISGLETLVQAHQLRAVRTAYLITRDRALAEDVVQAAFVRVYERINQFDSSRAFAPWFLRIVTNDAVKAAQRREHHASLDVEGTAAQPFADLLTDAHAAPDALAEHSAMQQAVWEALGNLPPEQRAVVVRRYYVGMSEAEMADELDVPRGTIKWRLHAARTRLQTLLRPWRPADDDAPRRHDVHTLRVDERETLL